VSASADGTHAVPFTGLVLVTPAPFICPSNWKRVHLPKSAFQVRNFIFVFASKPGRDTRQGQLRQVTWGFWKTLKFWDTSSVIHTTIETIQKTFREEKRKHPYRDPHAWLASTYGSRGGYTAAHLIHFSRTMMYSVLGEDAPTGLAYYFLTQEYPAAVSKFEAKMERLIAPALRLIRERQFVVEWEALNPWTAGNVPEMRKVVAERVKALACEMADHV
jgi:hypothetical protein